MDTKETKYFSYIKSKYPQFAIDKMECNFTDGKHGDIVIVNEKDVFKFARYDWSVGYIDNEVNVINTIGRKFLITVPRAELIEKGIGRFSYIRGEPLYRNALLQLGSRAQDMIAEQLADFLNQLHSIPIKGDSSNKIAECQLPTTQEEWLIKCEEIERKVFPYCDSYSKEYFRQIFKPLHENEKFIDFKPALIHGDLSPYHIIYNKNINRISGIIDFGLSGIGDPAYDIAILLDNYGESFIKRMSRFYKNIVPYLDRARFYAYINYALWAKALSDMLATRDFSNFRIPVKDRDIMPIGTKWI